MFRLPARFPFSISLDRGCCWQDDASGSGSGEESDSAGDELPYGGDMQRAIQAQDRDAIRTLMAARKGQGRQVRHSLPDHTSSGSRQPSNRLELRHSPRVRGGGPGGATLTRMYRPRPPQRAVLLLRATCKGLRPRTREAAPPQRRCLWVRLYGPGSQLCRGGAATRCVAAIRRLWRGCSSLRSAGFELVG